MIPAWGAMKVPMEAIGIMLLRYGDGGSGRDVILDGDKKIRYYAT